MTEYGDSWHEEKGAVAEDACNPSMAANKQRMKKMALRKRTSSKKEPGAQYNKEGIMKSVQNRHNYHILTGSADTLQSLGRCRSIQINSEFHGS